MKKKNEHIKNKRHSYYAKKINKTRALLNNCLANIVRAKGNLTRLIDEDREGNQDKIEKESERLGIERIRYHSLVELLTNYKRHANTASKYTYP